MLVMYYFVCESKLKKPKILKIISTSKKTAQNRAVCFAKENNYETARLTYKEIIDDFK